MFPQTMALTSDASIHMCDEILEQARPPEPVLKDGVHLGHSVVGCSWPVLMKSIENVND